MFSKRGTAREKVACMLLEGVFFCFFFSPSQPDSEMEVRIHGWGSTLSRELCISSQFFLFLQILVFYVSAFAFAY